MSVLRVGQRVVVAGDEGTVVALDVPCYGEPWSAPEWVEDYFIIFPYSLVRSL